jgi:hypothetical protein
VDGAARTGFEDSVRRLEEEMAGCAQVACHGPLPPYSFVVSGAVA